MRAAFHPASGYDYRASPRDRAISYGLSAIFAALILWMLIHLGIVPDIVRPQENNPIVVQMASGSHMSATKAKTSKSSASAAKTAKVSREPQPKSAPPMPVQKPPTPTWNVIPMGHDEFAQSDISTKSSSAARSADSSSDAGSSQGRGSGSTYGPGDGPDGQQLFNAEWYRRPSDAELGPYLAKAQPGWGEIACKTAPDFRVEDCRQLSESLGSGLSRALREAAWQFKVRPPRVNGQPQIGVWVRIHFDFTRTAVGSGGGGEEGGR